MYELLLELKERLNQIAIIGIGSIQEDFRLKKLQEKLKMLSSKAPVLAKLYELVTKLIEGKEVASYYMELNNLVDAILATQGNCKVEGEEKEIEVYPHQSIEQLTFMQMQEIRNILNGGTNTKWANLKKAYDEGKLVDYRLLEDFIENIGDTYEYVDYDYSIPYKHRQAYNMVRIICQYGKDVIPILLERFDTFKTSEKANTIRVIYQLAQEEYDDYYKKWAENEEADAVVAEALKALGNRNENIHFLLEFKTRKKKIQEARTIALAKIVNANMKIEGEKLIIDITIIDEKAVQEVKKQCLKDVELFRTVSNIVPFLNEDEFLEILMTHVQKLKEEVSDTTKNIYANQHYQFFANMIDVLDQYKSPKVLETIKEIMNMKSNDGKQCFESWLGTHVIGRYLYESQEPKRVAFLAEVKEAYDGYYLSESFLAALKCYDSEKVYDEFAELIKHKPIKGMTTIEEIIRQMADNTINGYGIYTYNDQTTQYIHLNSLGRIEISADIKWDKRWIEVAKKQNSPLLSSFFIKTSEEKEIYKQYYIKALENLQKEIGEDEYTYYSKKGTSQREKYVEELQGLFKGLLITGSQDKAIEAIPYFSYRIQQLRRILICHLSKTDLPLLEQLESTLGDYKDNKRKKLESFIQTLKENIE